MLITTNFSLFSPPLAQSVPVLLTVRSLTPREDLEVPREKGENTTASSFFIYRRMVRGCSGRGDTENAVSQALEKAQNQKVHPELIFVLLALFSAPLIPNQLSNQVSKDGIVSLLLLCSHSSYYQSPVWNSLHFLIQILTELEWGACYCSSCYKCMDKWGRILTTCSSVYNNEMSVGFGAKIDCPWILTLKIYSQVVEILQDWLLMQASLLLNMRL